MAKPRADFDVTDDPARFDEAISWFERKVPMPSDEFESLLDEDKEYAFAIANVTQADLVEQVFEELKTALREGKSLEKFKESVQDSLEEAWGSPDGGRVETIFRTNANAAYNAGRYAVYNAPAVKESRPYWRFEGVDDDRQSDFCEPFNDVVLPADDPFWDDHVPPLHYNCRSTITALDEEEAAEHDGPTEAPDQDADDGFGDAPDSEADDWKPDPGEYAKEIAGELADRLAGGRR